MRIQIQIFTFMRIRITILILIPIKVMRIWNLRPLVYRPPGPPILASAPEFFERPRPYFLESFWILTSMQIRIQLFILMWIRIRIQLPKIKLIMRIRIRNPACASCTISTFSWKAIIIFKIYHRPGTVLYKNILPDGRCCRYGSCLLNRITFVRIAFYQAWILFCSIFTSG